jgi:hypothetical protein
MLRERSKKLVPESYNERYLADVTAGRKYTAPAAARPATKKFEVAKPAPKKNGTLGGTKKLTKKQQEALATPSAPLTYEEREAKENAKFDAKLFAAGRYTY